MTAPKPSSASFATTQWTMVESAGSGDKAGLEALAHLCQAYWLPLYVYVRRKGYSQHDAEDLIQGFFAHLLERGAVKRADPARGRFRTFLLSSLKNYLHDAHDHAQAARRGGRTEKLSFDALEAADALVQVRDNVLTPDQWFDRSWTLALLDRAMKRLRSEQERLGKAAWFDRVHPCLQSRSDAVPYDEIAAQFGLTRNAVAVAIHRLSTRYRELVRAEIAETVCGAADVQAEQRHLLQSLVG